MAALSHTPTRRAMLGALATAPLLAAPSAAIASATASPALIAAIAAYDKACEAETAWDSDVRHVAHQAFRADCDKVPHRETTRTYKNIYGDMQTMSTEDVATARRVKAGFIKLHVEDEDYFATIDEVVALADKRDARIEALRAQHGLDTLCEEGDRLSELASAALESALNFKSRSLADVLAKAEFLEEIDGWGNDYARERLIADLRSFIGGRA